jgi:hypothetical protein
MVVGRRKREQLQALQSQVKGKNAVIEHTTRNSDNVEPIDAPAEPEPTLQTEETSAEPQVIQTQIDPTPIETVHRTSPSAREPVSTFVDFGFTAFPSESPSMQSDSINPDEITWFASTNSSSPSTHTTTNPTTAPEFDPFSTYVNSHTDLTSLVLSSTPTDLSSSLQERQTSTFSFPDDYLLTVLELDLLRACLSIAKHLGCDHLIWNLESISPFYGASHPPSTPGTPSPCAHIPSNLIPTRTQRHLPHHPILDLLPWPTVRDKLISVFMQPVELRPPAAADHMSLVQLVYDMEDSAEGIRIWGSDPFDSDGWEVGQAFFERWWWALDKEIVMKSNEWREVRGAGRLRLPCDGPGAVMIG